MILSSKADNLLSVKGRLKNGVVLDCYVFTVNEFRQNPEAIVKQLTNEFQCNVIVRSSARDEDTVSGSNAGHYISVSDVDYRSEKDILLAIEKVLRSYPKGSENYQILVQEMLENVDACGVLFTADQDTLSPYYILNYSEGNDTFSITSGSKSLSRTFIYYRNTDYWKVFWHKKLFKLAMELEHCFSNNKLDIEFAISGEKIVLLQVRPIVTIGKHSLEHVDIEHLIRGVAKKIEKLDRPSPVMAGTSFMLGLMPDWNPAEMLGVRPARLATSLYQELITNSVWAKQRAKYGYRDLEGCPLLVTLLNAPYIDIRASFNSFVPSDLPENLANKLVDLYLDKLRANPQLHDKVEFDVVFSCYHFNLSHTLKDLVQHGFANSEIEQLTESLRALTSNIIHPETSPFVDDLKLFSQMSEKRELILNSSFSDIDKIYHLTNVCKKYGTLPFSGAARCAFISIQLLRSLRDIGDLSDLEYDAFLESINTVSKVMADDSRSLSEAKWRTRYGHLRPGTYDITSASYREIKYAFHVSENLNKPQTNDFSMSIASKKNVLRTIKKHGFIIDVEQLFTFFTQSIEAREKIKFEFTRIIDDIFNLLLNFVSRYGITRHEAAFLDIGTILRFRNELSPVNIHSKLLSEISENKVAHNICSAIRLPYLIGGGADIKAFELFTDLPNYVTRKAVTAPVVLAKSRNFSDLAGKVVLIEAADPGYDFIFSHGIVGLITCFGGANSHMAIRCAELGIPGAIGVGEKKFKEILQAKSILIDAGGEKVEVMQ